MPTLTGYKNLLPYDRAFYDVYHQLPVRNLSPDGIIIMEQLLSSFSEFISTKYTNSFRMRHGLPPYSGFHTLKEVSVEFGISPERVRQMIFRIGRLFNYPTRKRKLRQYLKD